MKLFWAVLVMVFVVGCTAQTPAPLDEATRPLDERWDSPHYDHVGIAAHGSEAKLSCHGSTS